jgi:hypothetical protein
MATIYHIDITDGVIKFDHATAPRKANEYTAPNAKQYFAARGKAKPAPIAVRGWPFSKIYMTHGTEENGLAVAWA